MKSLIKLTLAFVLGIIITAAVLIPITSKAKPPEEPTLADLQSQIDEAVDEAVKQALAENVAKTEPSETQSTETTEVQTDQNDATETLESSESVETSETEETTESTDSTETTGTSDASDQTTQSASTSTEQVTKPKTASEYPKEFFENGKKYAYLNAYLEEQGIKMEVIDYPDGQSNAVQEGYYDIENAPGRYIPGPFQ